jgi:hypothetical protein
MVMYVLSWLAECRGRKTYMNGIKKKKKKKGSQLTKLCTTIDTIIHTYTSHILAA